MSAAIHKRLNEQEEEWLRSRLTDYRYREDWDNQTFLVATLNRILLLPWDTAWNTILLITGILLLVSYCSCFNSYLTGDPCWNQGSVVMVIEIMWVIDVTLTVASRTVQHLWKDHFRHMYTPIQNFGNRPNWIIVLEVISVIPFGYFIANLTDFDKKVVIMTRIFRGILKAIRFTYAFWFELSSLSYNLCVLLSFVFIMKSLLCLILVYITVMYCMKYNITNFSLDFLIYDIVSLVNTSGSSLRPIYFTYWPLIGVVAFIPIYWIVTLYLGMGKMTVYLMMLYQGKFTYLWAHNATMCNLRSLQIHKQCSREIKQYWNNIWTECHGDPGLIADTTVPYSPLLLMKNLPPAMAKGISADIGFQALKHASLFKKMDLPFLREVSAKFMQRNFLAGQYIFHRKELKETLVYVSQGTIELLSEEDAETPILTLTSGTLICETTVIFPTKSLVNVKCRTDCQLQILRRPDLLILARDFKKSYSKLVLRILERMQMAKEFKVMEDEVRLTYYPNARSSLAVMWIAKTLHRLMKLEFIKASRDDIHDNIYLERDMDESSYRTLLFNADYIDMLCLKRRTSHDDSVFVRFDGIHFILKPNSFLAYIWEGLIVLIALFTAMFMPYAVLVSGVVKEEWYKVMLLSITTTWILDLFIRVKISVDTKLGMLDTSIDILSYHLLSVSYYFDIFAALPLEAIAAMCDTSLYIRDITSLNRVLKIWRLANILYKYGQRPSANSLKMHMFILLLYFLYVIYFVACVLYALEERNTTEFYEIFYQAAQMLTGHTRTLNHENKFGNTFLFLNIILSFLSWFIHSVLFMLNLTKGMLFTQLKRWIHLHLHQTASVTKPYMKLRAYKYIETQIQDNLGASIVRLAKPAHASFMDMPKPVKISILYHVLSGRLNKHPLFQNILNSWMLKICSVANIKVIHPRETLFRCGDINKYMYILIEGRCKVFKCLDKDNQHKFYFIKPGDAVNEIEVIFNKPVFRTIVTETHCRFAVLDYHVMSNIMMKRQMDLYILKTMREFQNHPLLVTDYNFACTKPHNSTIFFKMHKPVSFVRHPFESDDHLRLYREVGFIGTIIQNIMMNTTFIPDGVFVYRWEVVRSIGLLISTWLFINPEAFHTSHTSDRLFLIMLFFDLWTLVDIYIRFHIGYFNENGILISHPLLTARFYFTRAFFIDLLPLLPIRYVVAWETFPQIVLFCHFIHLAQLYRYWYFIKSLDIATLHNTKLIRGLPLLLIMLSVGSTILLHVDCTIVIGTWGDAYFNCKNDSLFMQNTLSKKTRQFSVTYMYSLYVVSSLLTQCNLQGFEVSSYFDIVFVTIGSICGLMVRMMIFSFVAEHYYGKNRANTISHIDYANQLEKFMDSEELSHSLRNAVLNHYNAVRIMPLSIHKASEYMLMSIRRDALFENFAPRLMKANFLKGVQNADVFLRNILPHMTRLYVNRGLYLLRVNDITSDIYLVFDGIVKVLAPDGITDVAHLGPGCLIGNLHHRKHCRIQHMFFAQTMLETYTIPTELFYDFLPYFPNVQKNYNNLKLIYRNFINTNTVEIPKQVLVSNSQFGKIKRCCMKWKQLVIPATKRWFIVFTMLSISIFYLDILAVVLNGFNQDRNRFNQACLYETVTLLYIVNLILLPKVDFQPYSCSLMHQKTSITMKAHWFMYIIWISAALPYQALQALWVRMELTETESFALIVVVCNIKLLRLTWVKYIAQNYAGIMGIRIYFFKQIINAGIFILVIVLSAEVFIVAGVVISPNMNPPIQLEETSFVEHMRFVLNWIEFSSDLLMNAAQSGFHPIHPFFVFTCTVIMFLFLLASVFFVVDIVFTQLESQMRKAFDAHQLFKLQNYMRSWDVNDYMVARVLRYIHERYTCEVNLKIPPPVLQNAPLQLKVSLMDACYGELLEINPVFSHCHIHFIRQLSQFFEPFCYYPEDYIQYQGSMEPIMYFVHRGIIEELSEHDAEGCKRHRYITKAQTFGELQGFNIPTPLQHSYRAASPSVVLSLKYSSWSHMLDVFPASSAIISMQIKKFMRIHKMAEYKDIII